MADTEARSSDARVSRLEADVAAMKEKVSFFTVIYDKFDKTLDKIDARTIEDRKEINNMIAELQENIMQEIKAMRSDMANQHNVENKKIEDLNKWRYIVVGAVFVAGWIISKIFHT